MGATYSRARHDPKHQFGTIDAWGTYLTTLEGLTPKIEAIAATDYYVTFVESEASRL